MTKDEEIASLRATALWLLDKAPKPLVCTMREMELLHALVQGVTRPGT